MSASLPGGAGQLTATVTITRKATGETETYQLTGVVSPEQEAQLVEESAEQPTSKE